MANGDLDNFRNAAWWNELCPLLSINAAPLAPRSDFAASRELRSDDWQVCKDMIHEDGYFAYDAWFDRSMVTRMAECFRILEANDIHPVFAFVFDEFWDLLLQLRPLFGDLLGEYDCLPAVWSWHVKIDQQTGFSPHRDQVREVLIEDDDHLDYLTVWVPLTDLDHRSSSICVFPASLDPDFEEGTTEIRVENLQDIRSLQGKRGSVFCWSTQLAHWGTKQSEHGPPRMSVGYYIQRSSAHCLDGPPLDFSQPFTLDQRLAIIGQQIIDYSRTAEPSELSFANSLIDLG